MAFVLFGHPSVELVIGNEDLRVSEVGLAPLVLGLADGIDFLGQHTQESATEFFIEGCELITRAAHVMLPQERRQPSAVRFVESKNDYCSLQCSRPGCQLAGSLLSCSLLLLSKFALPFLQGCTQCCSLRF